MELLKITAFMQVLQVKKILGKYKLLERET